MYTRPMYTRRLHTRRLATVLAVAAVLVAGCTTVPTSSVPQVLRSADPGGAETDPILPPEPNFGPREVVQYFLDQNADTADLNGSAGHRVLATSWNPYPIYVVDRIQTSNPVAVARERAQQVTASGRLIGTITSAGKYTAASPANDRGLGSQTITQPFTLARVSVGSGRTRSHPWRISQLQAGTMLTKTQFRDRYQERSVYFLNSIDDGPGDQLVPDVRYSPITDPQDLAVFLVRQLAAGTTKTGLQTEFPQQPDNQQKVDFPGPTAPATTPVRVEIPSSRDINPKNSVDGSDNINRLAAQVAATLAQVPSVTLLEITDNGTPVRVPAVGGNVFSASDDVAAPYQVMPPADPPVYFVRDGVVHTKAGSLDLDTGKDPVVSVAVQPNASGGQHVAAVVAGATARAPQQLYVGTAPNLVRAKQVPGPLSRPSWQANNDGGDFAWIGAGAVVWRVAANGSAVKVPYQLNGQRVTAVRVSPDGARVALVLGANGAAQVYIGSIVGGRKPRIVDLATAVTPTGVVVADVAWNDDLELYATGHTVGNVYEFNVYEFQSDGSKWTPQDIVNLPGAPDSLTVASGQRPVVAAGSTLWQQVTPSTWQPLFGGFATAGTAPVFVE